MPQVLNTIRHNQFTLDGSAQQLNPGHPEALTLVLKALKTNANPVYVGDSNAVTANNGFPLEPGDSLSIDIRGGHQIWVIGTNTQKLAWMTVAS